MRSSSSRAFVPLLLLACTSRGPATRTSAAVGLGASGRAPAARVSRGPAACGLGASGRAPRGLATDSLGACGRTPATRAELGRRSTLASAAAAGLGLCFAAAGSARPVLAVAPPVVLAQQGAGAAESAAAAPSALTELIASSAGGAAQRLAKELLLHPIDTVRCRLELQGAQRSLQAPGLFADLYAGVAPSAVVGAPSGALFFAVKDAAKSSLRTAMGASYSKELSTVIAVLVAQLPYWAFRTPFELLKTRAQLGLNADGAWESARRIVATEGPAGLFVGLGSNVAYAAPTDVVKFLCYEGIKRRAKAAKGGQRLSPLESAVCGALGSAAAQTVCTPLDVVRTRVIAAQPDKGMPASAARDTRLADARNFRKVAARLYREEGAGAFFAGLIPRLGRAMASGGIQFGTYEATKRLFGGTDAD
ncbi:mitochondrial carrier domain-containing protein, partial [Pavlovales sp. CCMP2436]